MAKIIPDRTVATVYGYFWKHQFRKNAEVKQLGPQLALGWMTFQGLDVDAVAKNYENGLH